jgi:NAD-dependent DNA ligase
VETFDLSRAAAEALADEFESLDDILAASRDTLESVDKIGERRASKILHRRSDALEQRMQERAGAVPAVEDAEGVLRLPEEFEDGKYERK